MIDESDPRLPFGYIKMDEVLVKSACSHDFFFSISLVIILQLYYNTATLTWFQLLLSFFFFDFWLCYLSFIIFLGIKPWENQLPSPNKYDEPHA